MSLDEMFLEYFAALDRSGNEDRCFLCRRTPSDVKTFFGFHEDGTPIEPEQYGLEDVVLEKFDIMSYRGVRPVCAVCQLNFEAIDLSDSNDVLQELLEQIRDQRDKLWPPAEEA